MQGRREPTASSGQCHTVQEQAAWPPRPRRGAQPGRAHLRPGLCRPGFGSDGSCAGFSPAMGPLCCAAPWVSTEGVSMTASACWPLGPPDTSLQQPIAGLGLPRRRSRPMESAQRPRLAPSGWGLNAFCKPDSWSSG